MSLAQACLQTCQLHSSCTSELCRCPCTGPSGTSSRSQILNRHTASGTCRHHSNNCRRGKQRCRCWAGKSAARIACTLNRPCRLGTGHQRSKCMCHSRRRSCTGLHRNCCMCRHCRRHIHRAPCLRRSGDCIQRMTSCHAQAGSGPPRSPCTLSGPRCCGIYQGRNPCSCWCSQLPCVCQQHTLHSVPGCCRCSRCALRPPGSGSRTSCIRFGR